MRWDSFAKSFCSDLPRWRFLSIIFHTVFVILLVGFSASGYPAITWMGTFDVSEYPGWDGFATFVRELRTGIPPLQSICELGVYNLTGSFFLFSNILYRSALVFSYLVVLHWRKRSSLSFVISLVTGIVFLWSTVLVHRIMPMTYDVYFPALGLLFLILQPTYSGDGRTPRWLWTRCFLSGVTLSILELTRPFVLFILPFLLLGSLSALRPFGRKCLLLHLIPLLLLSGGWHLKIFMMHHGQIVWSNHSGFNLHRAWKEIGVELPPLVDENGAPVPPSNARLLNTDVHSVHNELLNARVRKTILHHPAAALRHAFKRLAAFLEPSLTMYRMTPSHSPLLSVYAPLVWISAAWLFWNLCRTLWVIGRTLAGPHPRLRHLFDLAGGKENQLIVMASLSLVILAMGESGEEVRLLVSVLPWMAVFPVGGAIPPKSAQPSVSPSIPCQPGV